MSLYVKKQLLIMNLSHHLKIEHSDNKYDVNCKVLLHVMD